MFIPLKKLSNNNGDDSSELVSDQREPQLAITPHSYPLVILIFWGVVAVMFVVNLLISCIWYVPLHLQASSKIQTINRLVENKRYFEALKIHKELCRAYPCSYVSSYGIEIATVCFECSRHNQLFFKEGVSYLKGRELRETEFSRLSRKVPLQLRETYINLFDVLCQEKNQKKEYLFTLNDEKVKLL
jgi:hypothetical protein